MSETLPQQPSEYLQNHPNAVEDPVKAEIMAYASSKEEENVVSERAKAIDAASNIGDKDFHGEGNRGAEHAASFHAERAASARETANAQAMGAAAIYDRVKAI